MPTRYETWFWAVVLMACLCATAQVATAAETRHTGLVLQDSTALRAAARESAPVQAQLTRGEALEIRGERLDYWQVWDYRRERGGYVRKNQLYRTGSGASDAHELLAALRITQHQAGAEALGLGLAATYVQAATPAELASSSGAEALATMAGLAERVADRITQGVRGADAQMDVATRYGLRFVTLEQGDGRAQTCYDGELFRRVLSLESANPEQKARAALALTRPECIDPSATPSARLERDLWRDKVLEHAPLRDPLPPLWKNRLHMRRAAVAASLAFARDGAASAQHALDDFARVVPGELADDDLPLYNDTAMRVNAVRWAARPASRRVPLAGGLSLVMDDGAEGAHCASLRDARQAELARRCSYGRIWLASASLNREANAIALAVQPIDGWRELWVFRKSVAGPLPRRSASQPSGEGGSITGTAWSVQVLPPAALHPGLGYAEFAGWVPGGQQMLVVREARAEQRYTARRFELVRLDTLTTERTAPEAAHLGVFQRWQDAEWRAGSLALR